MVTMGAVAWWSGLKARWRASTRFQDTAVALLIFAMGLALNLIGLIHVYPDAKIPALEGSPLWWHSVLLAIGCLAMLVKRHRPVLALSAGAVVTTADIGLGGSVGMVLVIFDLLFSAGMYAGSRARTTVMTCVVVLIGTVSVVIGLAVGDMRASVFMALQLTALLIVPLWWAANIRQQRELGQVNTERARHEAIDEERASMARELHDVIAAHLSTTAIHSGAALARPPDSDRDRAALQAVRQSSLAALEEMRSMITLLRASDSQAVAAAGLARLPDLVASAQATGMNVTLDSLPQQAIPALIDQAGYRIVSEALTNARKHAPGSAVHITVSVTDRLQVTVTNTLTQRPAALSEALSAGTGLWSMTQRAALLGGTVSARDEGGVWVVRASLPLRAPSGVDR